MTTAPAEIGAYEDIIDVRDVIARYEYIEDDEDETEEAAALKALLEELEGNGGDEQWRGDWYPDTLIRDRHFQDYAQELAEDVFSDEFAAARWPFDCIDWQQAANELQQDYGSVEFNGVTFWYR